jgi:hypothetical protein
LARGALLVEGPLERMVGEVISPLPQIAPRKHCVVGLWQGGLLAARQT